MSDVRKDSVSRRSRACRWRERTGAEPGRVGKTGDAGRAVTIGSRLHPRHHPPEARLQDGEMAAHAGPLVFGAAVRAGNGAEACNNNC